MNKKIEEKIDNFVTDFCWTNCPGDIFWSNDFYRCAIKGAKIAEKEYKKKIRDKYNHLNSELKQENKMKLAKVINEERVRELEIQTKLLKELLD